MKTYAVKTGGDAKPVGIMCESIVLRDDHVTFFGIPEQDQPQRVGLTRGWYIHEVHPPEAKKIEVIAPKIIITG